MKNELIFGTIIGKMPSINKSFVKFLSNLVFVILSARGRKNFMNMSRWSPYNELSFRRNYDKTFDWIGFNEKLISHYADEKEVFIACIDASFIPKSGHHTANLGHFWSGCQQKTMKGLELSLLAIVSVTHQTAYALDSKQTPAILPDAESRLDFYLQQLEVHKEFFVEKQVKYLVCDGFYAKEKTWEKAASVGLSVITKLRVDANLKWLYVGEQKSKGRPRKYADKINWKLADLLDKMDLEYHYLATEKEYSQLSGCKLYSKVVYSVQWKRNLKIVVVVKVENGKQKTGILACSDLTLSAQNIAQYYCLRFQIEFIFRDMKQHLGLTESQTRKEKRIDFHFNSVAMAYNITKIENKLAGNKIFSLYDIKADYINQNYLETIITNLDLDVNAIKMHPNYEKLLKLGKINI
jgi:hypothetical protein